MQRLALLLPAKDHLPGVLEEVPGSERVEATPLDRGGGLRVKIWEEREEMLDLAGQLVASFSL